MVAFCGSRACHIKRGCGNDQLLHRNGSCYSAIPAAIGIGIALVILIVLAVAIIQFSVRLPVRWFFLTATPLIYYLVFRFLGESIHALQVSATLPAHVAPDLPALSWLGLYPTWETFVPQMAVLLYIIFSLIRTEKRSIKGASKASV